MAEDVVVVPVTTPSPVATPPTAAAAGGGAVASGGERPFREVYADNLAADAARMPPGSYPEVEIRYEALSYVLQLPKTTVDRKMKTVAGAFLDMAMTPLTVGRQVVSRLSGTAPSTTAPFVVLDKVSGVLKPGTVTLLLSPPGHGKTSFLRALAGRLPWSALTGEVRYSGLTPKEAAAAGVQVKQLVQYVEQLDTNLPELTVRETLEFANFNGTVDPSVLADPALQASAARRVDDVIQLLSLTGCQHTVVGNDLLRGVSGGEKKRVTIGEAMVTNARVLMMDEISTGLDSAVTFDIVSGIRSWARATRGTVVIALLQPTPEVYGLFDDVIMLREGAVLYHGPRTAVPAYMESLGYYPPTAAHPPSGGAAAGGAAAAVASAAGSTTTAPPLVIDLPPVVRAVSGGEGGGSGGAKVDVADWLVEFLSHPSHTWVTSHAAAAAEGVAPAKPVAPAWLSAIGLTRAPVTTPELSAAWAASATRTEVAAARAAAPPTPTLALTAPFAKAQYGHAYSRTAVTHFWSLVARQARLTIRNKLFLVSRLVAAIVMAVVLGTTFYRQPVSSGASRYGMFLFGALQASFSNFSEVPIAVVSKYTTYKHFASGMYPSTAYVLSVVFIHAPLAIVETLIFTAIMYPTVGLVDDVGRYFFFAFTLFLVSIAMAAFFRIFAYAFPDMETAQVAPGPFMSIQMLFAGFLITRSKMGWLTFMHYISVFGYALRSLAQNEFLSSSYSAQPLLPTSEETVGEIFLEYFDFSTNPAWKWGGIGFIVAFFVVLVGVSGTVLARVRIERNIGTARKSGSVEEAVEESGGGGASDEGADVEEGGANPLPLVKATSAFGVEAGTSVAASGMPMSPLSPSLTTMPSEGPLTSKDSPSAGSSSAAPASPSAAAPPMPGVLKTPSRPAVAATKSPSGGVPARTAATAALPFTPMTVAWSDVTYCVPVAANKAAGTAAFDKMLLQGVSGYAAPGTLTALMGASGAGKTTLLDVIAGRKNSGKMTGAISLNGFPKEQRSFARLTAYVEQTDIHSPLQTVREALYFSAALRLPATVTAAQRAAHVAEVLTLLELEPIADRQIGEVGAADGLAPGERKRLTIGVELAANAPILFLDEPTTGLDSRAAAVVMRTVKRVAASGRTVISTIHQPSAELFLMFDNLLLLQRGGWQVYMGPVGRRGRDLVRYLEGVPGTPRCPRRMNPASWMLDVLAGTDSSGEVKRAVSAPAAHHLTAVTTTAAGGVGAMADLVDGVEHAIAAAAAAVVGGSVEGAGAITSRPSLAHADVIARMASSAAGSRSGVVVPAGALDATRGPPSSTSPGPVDYQAILRASKMGHDAVERVTALSTPTPGTQPYRFDSLYARGFLFQLWQLLIRTNSNYARNVGYNYTRVMTLVGLHILFGVIYYKVTPDSVGGVQSLVSVVFMTSAFVALMNMNVGLPVMLKERAVFYRERFSYLYGSTPYGLASIIVELPWIGFVIITSIPVIYFMVGLDPSAGAFFRYCFVVFVFSVAFISMAQLFTAIFSGIEVAQAAISLLIPIMFLFGGLFARYPTLPAGWRWMYWADPIHYALEALVVPIFYCEGTGCPTLTYVTPDGVQTVDTLAYVEESFGISYSNRWLNVGYLCVFIAGLQIMHFVALRYVSHIKR